MANQLDELVKLFMDAQTGAFLLYKRDVVDTIPTESLREIAGPIATLVTTPPKNRREGAMRLAARIGWTAMVAPLQHIATEGSATERGIAVDVMAQLAKDNDDHMQQLYEWCQTHLADDSSASVVRAVKKLDHVVEDDVVLTYPHPGDLPGCPAG